MKIKDEFTHGMTELREKRPSQKFINGDTHTIGRSKQKHCIR